MSDCRYVSECMSMCVGVFVYKYVWVNVGVLMSVSVHALWWKWEICWDMLASKSKVPIPWALEQSCGCRKQVLGLSYRFCLSPVPATSKSTLCYHVTIYLAGLSVSLLSPAVLKHSDPKWLGEVDANLFLRSECIGGGWCWGRNWGRNHGGCCLLARSQLLLS